jgi:hypothetical protein
VLQENGDFRKTSEVKTATSFVGNNKAGCTNEEPINPFNSVKEGMNDFSSDDSFRVTR